MAIRIFNGLCDSMGAINWAGFELLAERFGISNVEGLIDRLLVIKSHEPPKPMG